MRHFLSAHLVAVDGIGRVGDGDPDTVGRHVGVLAPHHTVLILALGPGLVVGEFVIADLQPKGIGLRSVLQVRGAVYFKR